MQQRLGILLQCSVNFTLTNKLHWHKLCIPFYASVFPGIHHPLMGWADEGAWLAWVLPNDRYMLYVDRGGRRSYFGKLVWTVKMMDEWVTRMAIMPWRMSTVHCTNVWTVWEYDDYRIFKLTRQTNHSSFLHYVCITGHATSMLRNLQHSGSVWLVIPGRGDIFFFSLSHRRWAGVWRGMGSHFQGSVNTVLHKENPETQNWHCQFRNYKSSDSCLSHYSKVTMKMNSPTQVWVPLNMFASVNMQLPA